VLAFAEGGKLDNLEKTLRVNPTHIRYLAGIEPGSHWWEASTLTTLPPHSPLTLLLLMVKFYFKYLLIQ